MTFQSYYQYLLHSLAANEDTKSKILRAKHVNYLKEIEKDIMDYQNKKENCEVLKKVLVAQFQQNEEIRKELLNTGSDILGYTHSKDLFLGVGFKSGDPLSQNKTNWKGQNKLGELLMEVREKFNTGELKPEIVELNNSEIEKSHGWKDKVKVINTDCCQELCNNLEEKFTYFWRYDSPFSQHYPVEFKVDGVTFNCVEQYYMFKKAEWFDDKQSIYEIMRSRNPMEQKSLERKVVGFDKKVWDEVSRSVVRKGNFAKFSQHEDLLQVLLSTRGTTLVETSPKDDLWGINLESDNYSVLKREWWCGKNWLGEELTKLRDKDFKDKSYSESFFCSNTDASMKNKHKGYTGFFRSSSPFSPWHITPFTVHSQWYVSLHHYLMHQSAVLFGCKNLAEDILKCIDQQRINKLTNKNQRFEETRWNENVKRLIVIGNYYKFLQHDQFRSQLLNTKNTVLVYYDADNVVGNGIEANVEKDCTLSSHFWSGQNILGFVLTHMRDEWLLHGSGAGGSSGGLTLEHFLKADISKKDYNLMEIDSLNHTYQNKMWEYRDVLHKSENLLKNLFINNNDEKFYNNNKTNFHGQNNYFKENKYERRSFEMGRGNGWSFHNKNNHSNKLHQFNDVKDKYKSFNEHNQQSQHQQQQQQQHYNHQSYHHHQHNQQQNEYPQLNQRQHLQEQQCQVTQQHQLQHDQQQPDHQQQQQPDHQQQQQPDQQQQQHTDQQQLLDPHQQPHLQQSLEHRQQQYQQPHHSQQPQLQKYQQQNQRPQDQQQRNKSLDSQQCQQEHNVRKSSERDQQTDKEKKEGLKELVDDDAINDEEPNYKIRPSDSLNIMTESKIHIDGKTFRSVVHYVVFKQAEFQGNMDYAEDCLSESASPIRILRLREKLNKEITGKKEDSEKNLTDYDYDKILKEWVDGSSLEEALKIGYEKLFEKDKSAKKELEKSGNAKLVQELKKDANLARASEKVLMNLRSKYFSKV